jgi:hypothetical protein
MCLGGIEVDSITEGAVRNDMEVEARPSIVNHMNNGAADSGAAEASSPNPPNDDRIF